MKDILLSIILPVYNVEKYIGFCLDSIVTQDLQKCEIVIVDDGTLDSSGIICDEYASKYNQIKVIHNSNAGSYKTRLIGAGVANGEYVWFVDSDDWIADNSVSRLIKILEENEYPDVVMFDYAVNGYKIVRDRHQWTQQRFDGIEKKEIIQVLLESDSVNAIWRKVIRRDLVVNNEYLVDMDGFSYGEDAYISAAVFVKMNSIVFSHEVFYSYRENLSSMTRNFNIRRLENQEVLFNRLLEIAHFFPFGNDVKRKIENRKTNEYMQSVKQIVIEDKPWKDKWVIIQAMGRMPFWADCCKRNNYDYLDNDLKKIANVLQKGKIAQRILFGRFWLMCRVKKGIKILIGK